jgi:hypothetical protein
MYLILDYYYFLSLSFSLFLDFFIPFRDNPKKGNPAMGEK